MRKLIVLVAVAVMVAASAQAWDIVNGSADGFNVKGSTLKIDGTAVTKTAAELNTVNAGASITGNIPQVAITNALITAGPKIGGHIPVAAVTNALNQTASAVTNVIVSADAKTNTFIIVPVGQVNVIRSWVVTQ